MGKGSIKTPSCMFLLALRCVKNPKLPSMWSLITCFANFTHYSNLVNPFSWHSITFFLLIIALGTLRSPLQSHLHTKERERALNWQPKSSLSSRRQSSLKTNAQMRSTGNGAAAAVTVTAAWLTYSCHSCRDVCACLSGEREEVEEVIICNLLLIHSEKANGKRSINVNSYCQTFLTASSLLSTRGAVVSFIPAKYVTKM